MNSKILEQIEQNTSPKTSTQIVVSDNSTRIKTTFHPPLELLENMRWLWLTFYEYF